MKYKFFNCFLRTLLIILFSVLFSDLLLENSIIANQNSASNMPFLLATTLFCSFVCLLSLILLVNHISFKSIVFNYLLCFAPIVIIILVFALKNNKPMEICLLVCSILLVVLYISLLILKLLSSDKNVKRAYMNTSIISWLTAFQFASVIFLIISVAVQFATDGQSGFYLFSRYKWSLTCILYVVFTIVSVLIYIWKLKRRNNATKKQWILFYLCWLIPSLLFVVAFRCFYISLKGFYFIVLLKTIVEIALSIILLIVFQKHSTLNRRVAIVLVSLFTVFVLVLTAPAAFFGGSGRQYTAYSNGELTYVVLRVDTLLDSYYIPVKLQKNLLIIQRLDSCSETYRIECGRDPSFEFEMNNDILTITETSSGRVYTYK